MARCATLKTVVDIAMQAALAMLTPHAELPTGSDVVNAHGGRSWALITAKPEFKNQNHFTKFSHRIAFLGRRNDVGWGTDAHWPQINHIGPKPPAEAVAKRVLPHLNGQL